MAEARAADVTPGVRPQDELSRLSSEERAEMGARGSLEVEDRAVERIAAAAATEVDGVAPAHETAGGLAGALGRAYPRVSVHVAGRRVRAEVEVVTHWPHPAAEVAAAVRGHVSERLRSLAALDVDSVQVQVAKVIRPSTPQRRRVQ